MSVRRNGQELDQFRRERKPQEELPRLVARLHRSRLLAHLLGREPAGAHPLPDLRPRDLRRRRVLHQIVDRGRADAVEPRVEVADPDRDVRPQPLLGDLPRRVRDREQRRLVGDDVVALPLELVRPLAEHRVEALGRDGDEIGMRDPRAVEAGARLALLVLAHLAERDRVHLGILARRDERSHAADRVCAAPVARPHEQLGVRVHERHRHRHLHPVGQHPVARPELLDAAEDVVPAARVQRAPVVAKLVEDLVHLERGEDRLDQHGAADRAVRQPELILGERERLRPEPRLEVRLELRQVEVRPAAAVEQLARVVEHHEPEVEEAAGDRLAVDHVMPLGKMPAARPDDQRRRSRRSAGSSSPPYRA